MGYTLTFALLIHIFNPVEMRTIFNFFGLLCFSVLAIVLVLLILFGQTNAALPVVVLHGIASSAAKMDEISAWIREEFQVQVFNIEIGNGAQSSLYMSMPGQLDVLCDVIYKNPDLAEGFNFIGMSQGGLLARGYVERCNKYPVSNLITLVSPHGGVYLETGVDMYTEFIQMHLSIAGYWRNPRDLERYLEKCNYLPLLNNEIHYATKQKENMEVLNNLVLIWSPRDDVLFPPESGKFSTYDRNLGVVPVRETDIYRHDLLGLKYLDESNRFHIYETNCTHVEHRDPICFSQLYSIFKLFLT